MQAFAQRGRMPFLFPRLTRWLLLLLLAGCSAGEHRAAPAQKIDDFGFPLPQLSSEASRIVSLNPTTTEILFTIGAGESVVGRAEYDNFPAAARRVRSLGPALGPNVEVILAARPDLVLLYASGDNRPAARQLRSAGIRVVGLKIDRIADFERATRMLGRLTGHEREADLTADTVLATLDSVRKATATLPRPRVFWHIWDQPIMTIGGGSFLSELLDIAGADNIYGDLEAASPPVTLEDIVKRDPDFILAGPVNASRLASDARWQAVRAVSTGSILVVDTTLVGRPSVKLGQAAVHLARLLHPAVGR